MRGVAIMLQINNVCHAYRNENDEELWALDHVSLEIAAGEFVAVIGRNGSGKSTLAKHLNALLIPGSGTCIIDGIDTKDSGRIWDIRQRVGMVFQNPDNQIVASIVEEDVAFGPENLGLPPAEIRRRVDEALAMVGMTEYRLHGPHLLSGGQKQRVAIAGDAREGFDICHRCAARALRCLPGPRLAGDGSGPGVGHAATSSARAATSRFMAALRLRCMALMPSSVHS